MGGEGTRHSHFSSAGGDFFAESELLGMAYLGFSSSSSSSSCCCCCGRCCGPSCDSPTSELELEVQSASRGGVADDHGVCGALSCDHGEAVGGRGEGEGVARFSGAGDDGTRSRDSSAVALLEEPPIWMDGASSDDTYTEEEISRRRRRRMYLELLRSYHDGGSSRLALLEEAKDAIARYTPGKWIERVGGTTPSDFCVPSTTTLLLVGLRGSGKSALVNRISRLLEDNPLLPDRAQVSHNVSMTERTSFPQEHMIPRGTYFMQEYLMPRDSTSFCVYDTRGLSEVPYENFDILKRWMAKGIRHGEMVLRDKDFSTMKSKVKAMVRGMQWSLLDRRRVNFVIFVVNGISVMKSINGLYTPDMDMLVKTFNYSFMSFKDNKPAVVITHGDLLSFHERALVCTHLGEIFGIPATKQIFDIPDLDCPMTKLAIVDLLRYSLEQADRNFPLTSEYEQQGTKLRQWMVKQFQDFEIWILILEIAVIFICVLMFLTQSLGKLTK